MEEFHYRFPSTSGGHRPGAHPGSTLGSGMKFAAHMRLFDHPDPRRLDLRASLRDANRQWLVRLHRHRASIPVYAVVDVSASMNFGAPDSKLQIATKFAEALGHSAFRLGDSVGMFGFDSINRDDLYLSPRHGRGAADLMAEMLRNCRCNASADGVATAIKNVFEQLAGKTALVFLVSDFHWPLTILPSALDLLGNIKLIPIVIWDAGEIEPPRSGAMLEARELENGQYRHLWMNNSVRARWRESVSRRRREIGELFAARGITPFWMLEGFDPDALSHYFFESVA